MQNKRKLRKLLVVAKLATIPAQGSQPLPTVTPMLLTSAIEERHQQPCPRHQSRSGAWKASATSRTLSSTKQKPVA
eukprot:6474750-Amphidinium_carterae.2